MRDFRAGNAVFALLVLIQLCGDLRAEEPVARWDFEEIESASLEARGNPQWKESGPRPPEFPDMDEENAAVRLDGKSYFSVMKSGEDARFAFTNGDAVTLEAWVRLDGLRDSQAMYVIGKGRTSSDGFARDNQNWAMRIIGEKGVAKLSFLFAAKPGAGSSHWHRWTSQSGFKAATGWHHVAVAYRFGQPKSIRGWIDSQPTIGVWDMGGETKEPPVVDEDEVWIGSALGGNPYNSFRGWLDAIAVHRVSLSDESIAERFNRVGGPRIIQPLPEVMPELEIPKGRVLVTFAEGLAAHHRWQHAGEPVPREITSWLGEAFLLLRIPLRFDDWGIRDAWKAPLLVRVAADVQLPVGRNELLLRARSLSRLWVDGKVVARTKPITHQPPNGEEPITPLAKPPLPGVRVHGYHQQEVFGTAEVANARPVRVVLEMVVGGKNYRSESGEVCVAIKTQSGKSFDVFVPVVGKQSRLPLTDASIEPMLAQIETSLTSHDDQTRRKAAASQDPFWRKRHEFARAWAEDHPAPLPTPNSDDHPIDQFIAAKIKRQKADVKLADVVNDESFLRRIFLDTIGIPPTQPDIESFLTDDSAEKRARVIERLLKDERCAAHAMSFWLDLLAENPTLLNGSLNSTGPFRWFLYDSLRDNKPLDRMVTELIMMRGGQHEGGSAGFAMAAENDAPFAAKGHILASAFLGIELQCARCHDSPYHSTKQEDLYSLSAMLARKSVKVPGTSSVPAAFFEKKARESLIQVTLEPGKDIAASWPFAATTGIEDSVEIDQLMHDPKDSRERLAALITSPTNQRFACVVVNRLWQRLIGVGLVEPVHDWEECEVSHPQLLDWLAHELVAHDYDTRHVVRLIVTSKTYQREAVGNNRDATAERRFFNAPERRRLRAEQIVDSLHAVTGRPMNVEELTFVHDGRRAISNRLSLGRPTRAWMFASLNNERDRPSLSLPRARAVADVLEAFGWTGSRQQPIKDRDAEPNVLQPGILANGTLSTTLTRAAYGSSLAQFAVDAQSPEGLVDSLFLRVLSRRPKPDEHVTFTRALSDGFEGRLVPSGEMKPPAQPPALPLVTWFNHLQSEANTIQQEVERRVRQGPPPDPRLRARWREVYEDVVWSLINHREFVWMP